MSRSILLSQPAQQPSSVRFLGALEESAADFNQRLHLPDSHPGLLINLGAPLALEMDDGRWSELPRVFFGRVQFSHIKVRATGACQYIGLDMFAWGTRFLVDEQVDLAAMPIVPLGGVWDDLARTLDVTFHRHSEAEALALLEEFVVDLHRRKQIDVTPVRTALDILYSTDGQFSLPELAARCYLSPSQLERQFKYHTGVSPKVLARSIRLDAMLATMLKAPARPMTYLAQRYGYTDQAHFIHEFKTFTGTTPRQFLAARA